MCAHAVADASTADVMYATSAAACTRKSSPIHLGSGFWRWMAACTASRTSSTFLLASSSHRTRKQKSRFCATRATSGHHVNSRVLSKPAMNTLTAVGSAKYRAVSSNVPLSKNSARVSSKPRSMSNWAML